MKNIVNPTTQAHRRYRLEAIISLIALVALATCQSLTWQGASERWRITVNLTVMIPIVFFFAAFVRYTLRTDELSRKTTVESLAIAGGVTALIAMIYALLESMSIGLPRPHAIWTFNTFVFSHFIGRIFVRRHYK